MPGNTKMGFEGQIFIGAPGAVATNQVLNAVDANYNMDNEKGSTVVRGTGLTPPVGTESVTKIMASFEFGMINDITDSLLQMLLVAAATGAGIALRTKDHSAGKGYDGDSVVTMQHGEP